MRSHSSYTFSVNQRVPSQQSSIEKVDGKSASPSRDSSESDRFVPASLPLAIGNFQKGLPSQQTSSEKVNGKSTSLSRGSSESGCFVVASLHSGIGNLQESVTSQQSSTDKVRSQSTSLSRDSTESGLFIAPSVPSGIGNVQFNTAETVVKPQFRLPYVGLSKYSWGFCPEEMNLILGRLIKLLVRLLLWSDLQTSLHTVFWRYICHILSDHLTLGQLIKVRLLFWSEYH